MKRNLTWRLACGCLGGVCLLILAGCGSSGDRNALQGMVTLDGEPLAKGSIRFRPLSGTTGPTAGGPIQEGGFSITSDQGTFVGKFRVEITATRKTGRTIRGSFGGVEAEEDQHEQYLPARYNHQSELTAEVTEAGPNRFEFALLSISK